MLDFVVVTGNTFANTTFLSAPLVVSLSASEVESSSLTIYFLSDRHKARIIYQTQIRTHTARLVHGYAGPYRDNFSRSKEPRPQYVVRE